MHRTLSILKLGTEPYKKIWDLQHQIHRMRVNSQINDVLILLQHNHVYTLGKVAKKEHLLLDEKLLIEQGIDLFEIDRGGDITYHGPGQIVGYPILKLNELYEDTHRYLRELEEVIIRVLNEYNIQAYRIPEYTGVWVNDEKIAAIGIKISRWVTMHGFAFNINTNLEFFDKIIPCGIFDKGVTSLKKVLGKNVDLSEVGNFLIKHFVDVFKYKNIEILFSLDDFQNKVGEKILEGV